MASRGLFIVFEGLDRSGKTTQAKELVKTINQKSAEAGNPNPAAIIMNFPDRQSVIGKLIDQYLKKEIDLDEHSLHLMFSADRFLKNQMIRESVANGIDVICDRYCYSGVAYSLAKGLPETWVRSSDVGLPKPDAVLFFDVSPEVAAKRGGFGQERLETSEMQKKVAAVMPTLRDDAFWKTVNADGDMETVEKEVFRIYEQLDRQKPFESLEKI
uniref:Thymidylate kinase n=1 Tax=Caenorhabditis tropicalis TaxID=1561998 RepID=A0A1I7T7U3_9PELO